VDKPPALYARFGLDGEACGSSQCGRRAALSGNAPVDSSSPSVGGGSVVSETVVPTSVGPRHRPARHCDRTTAFPMIAPGHV
jgi:hypothetical protein